MQIRCLYEGLTVEQMLTSWHDMLPAKMKEWGLERSKVGTPRTRREQRCKLLDPKSAAASKRDMLPVTRE